MGAWWRWLTGRGSERHVSRAWIWEQERREDRAGFEGVSIRWPIKKLVNESPVWNREKLKRRA